MATISAVQMGASFKPGKLLECKGKSYPATAGLAAIKKQGTADGGDDSTSTAGRRKSKHCVPRFCEVIALEENRGRWAEHRTKLTRQELDTKVTNKTRNILIDVWEQMKDPSVEVRVSSCAGCTIQCLHSQQVQVPLLLFKSAVRHTPVDVTWGLLFDTIAASSLLSSK